jgi:hypothetical protein
LAVLVCVNPVKWWPLSVVGGKKPFSKIGSIIITPKLLTCLAS